MFDKISRVLRKIEPKQLPLLDVEKKGMKRVFWLSDELKRDPSRVEAARALTLNPEKPLLGLKGTQGLFASSEWWDAINKKRIPLLFLSGKIVDVYEAGQDKMGVVNTVDLELANKQIEPVGIYVNEKSDISLFKVGAHVEIVYARDELKCINRDGTIAHSKTCLEVAVTP